METLWQDLHYAIRMLRKRPGFTAAVVLVLALGIGANSAIFSVVDAVMLRSLPYKEPDRLVYVWETNLKLGQTRGIVSPANYLDWKDQNQCFEQTAGWRFLYFNLTGKDEPERVQGLIVSASFFPLLGINAARGRTFLPEEDQPGRNKVVVLSHRLWQRRFGGDLNLVGQQITVEGEPYTVVGILPADFKNFHVLNRPLDLYQPLALDPKEARREEHAIFVYARLKPGVSLGQAQAEMDTFYRRLEQEYPATNSGWGAKLVPLPEAWTERSRSVLLMLLAAVGFVLLIACANIANLMLTRAAARQKEMAVRMALGASRLRLARQLLTESLLLALLGGTVGLLLAFWAAGLLNDFVPYTAINRMDEFRLDGWGLGFTFGLSLLTGVIFGLAPALQSSRLNLNESLKEGGKSSTEGFRGRRLRNLLVISEVALSVMLLVCAGLMIKSTWRLQEVKRGLDLHNVLTMQIWLPKAKYSAGRQVANFFHQLLQRVETLPGVESASAVNFPPLALQSTAVNFTVEGRATPTTLEDVPTTRYWVVTPDYFRTTGIALLSGRAFTEQDADEKRGAAIVSENFARRFWPGEDAVGKRLTPLFPKLKAFWLPEANNLPVTVVGVVRDIKHDGLDDNSLPQMYLPYRQNPSSIMNLLVRTPSDPMRWAAAVRREVYAVDGDQPVFDIKTMEDVVAESSSQPRVLTSLLGVFAALALMLAAVGIYGVVAYSVSQRTHEIGIRIALGAQQSNILRLVVGQGLVLVTTGVAIGLVGAFVVTRVLSSLLFGVSTTDPLTFGGTTLLLVGVAVLACYIPARKAAKVDPMVALRCE